MMEKIQQPIIELLWQAMNLPESCLLNTRIYKKMLLESSEISKNDKKIVTEDIDTLIWRYTLKPETINIPKLQTEDLDYPEIAVIHIVLKSPKRVKRLVEIIQRSIPYPLVLIISHDKKLWFSLANKRQSMADSQKLMVENFFDSNWIDGYDLQPIEQEFIDSIDSKQLDWTNFHAFYQGLVERLLALQVAQLTGKFRLECTGRVSSEIKENVPDRRMLLQNIRQLEEKTNNLKASLNKETQFNRRLELNMNIKHCEEQIKQLTNEL